MKWIITITLLMLLIPLTHAAIHPTSASGMGINSHTVVQSPTPEEEEDSMWEVYLAIVFFALIYGFIKISTGLQPSDTEFQDYDKIQNTAVSLLKYLFILLAVGVAWLGIAITPQVIEASQNDNATAINNINEITEDFSWAISASWITYFVLGLIFFISFFLITYTGIIQKLFFGKKRRKHE